MKLNNKGMSIIEITVTFTLIMAMVIGMLTIVMNYRDKVSISLKKLEMDTFKNTLTKDIQDDITALGVEEINTSGECNNIQGLNKCINIVFKDGTEKVFGTSYVSVDDIDSIENKYIYYDGDKYKLKDNLPDSIPEDRNILDLQTIIMDDSEILKTTTTTSSNGSEINIYTINVNVSHFDFDEDFGVHIVVSNDNTITGDSAMLLSNLIFSNSQLVLTEPDLTSIFEKTNEISGLYKSAITNNGDPTYYFRGEVGNNYVEFASIIWRIVRINEDGTIRLITDTEVESNKYSSVGGDTLYESLLYYSNSDAKNLLDNWFDQNIVLNGYSDKVATGEYFCEQFKCHYGNNSAAEVIGMTGVPNCGDGNYIPNFKCENDGLEHSWVNSNVGLINYDEVIHAGGSIGLTSTKYYLYSSGLEFWTMSIGGYLNGPFTTDGYTHNWAINRTNFSYIRVNDTKAFRPVINLKVDVMATGSGLIDDPYVIQ